MNSVFRLNFRAITFGLFGFLSIAILLALFVFAGAVEASDTPDPTSVTVAGNLQSEIGCAEDWNPGCTASDLIFDSEDKVWQRAFTVAAGNYEYKAALNHTWDENYGANATRGGANIGINLASETPVKFY